MSKSKTTKRLTTSVATIVVLAVCLCITTFALVYSTVAVDSNLFQTGKIKVNLNDGRPVIEEDEFLFEPGMTVNKDFTLSNTGTADVYYKLYFRDVSGELADVLEVTLTDGSDVLYTGTLSGLTRSTAATAPAAPTRNDRLLIDSPIFLPPLDRWHARCSLLRT